MDVCIICNKLRTDSRLFGCNCLTEKLIDFSVQQMTGGSKLEYRFVYDQKEEADTNTLPMNMLFNSELTRWINEGYYNLVSLDHCNLDLMEKDDLFWDEDSGVLRVVSTIAINNEGHKEVYTTELLYSDGEIDFAEEDLYGTYIKDL